jgi:hypothetical protein
MRAPAPPVLATIGCQDFLQPLVALDGRFSLSRCFVLPTLLSACDLLKNTVRAGHPADPQGWPIVIRWR